MTDLPRVVRCTSLQEFSAFMASAANEEAAMLAFEQRLLGEERFAYRGRCVVRDREVDFLVDHDHC